MNNWLWTKFESGFVYEYFEERQRYWGISDDIDLGNMRIKRTFVI